MQQGLAGPATNILQSMGIELPQNADGTWAVIAEMSRGMCIQARVSTVKTIIGTPFRCFQKSFAKLLGQGGFNRSWARPHVPSATHTPRDARTHARTHTQTDGFSACFRRLTHRTSLSYIMLEKSGRHPRKRTLMLKIMLDCRYYARRKRCIQTTHVCKYGWDKKLTKN